MTADIYALDCLVGLSHLPDGCAALVFLDLPYGVTQNDWDRRVPMEPLWEQLRRVGRPTCVYVFTAVQPFTSLVVRSNLEWFRYEMIWLKNRPSGHLNAKKQPLRRHENVLVFYANSPEYVPQKTVGHDPMNSWTCSRSLSGNYGEYSGWSGGGSTERYPTTALDNASLGLDLEFSVLEIDVVRNNKNPDRIHPNQKPEELPAWFIKTYTKPGDLVIDPTAGSGSTLKAAARLGRRAIGFDTDAAMVERVRRDLEGLSRPT